MNGPIDFPDLDLAKGAHEDPADADLAYLAGVTEQCISRYGSYRCEREDAHPLPHLAHIKTQWMG